MPPKERGEEVLLFILGGVMAGGLEQDHPRMEPAEGCGSGWGCCARLWAALRNLKAGNELTTAQGEQMSWRGWG